MTSPPHASSTTSSSSSSAAERVDRVVVTPEGDRGALDTLVRAQRLDVGSVTVAAPE